MREQNEGYKNRSEKLIDQFTDDKLVMRVYNLAEYLYLYKDGNGNEREQAEDCRHVGPFVQRRRCGVKRLDNFMRIIAEKHVSTEEFHEGLPKPDAIIDKLVEILSENLVMEFDDMLSNYAMLLEKHCIVEGMKVAIELMNEEYSTEL